MHRILLIIFRTKHCEWIISLPGMLHNRLFIWMSYHNFLPGQDVNIIFRNFHWKATDKL